MSLKEIIGIDTHTINGATLFGVGLAVVALRNDFLWSPYSLWVMIVGGFWFIFLGWYEFYLGVKERLAKKVQQ